MLDLDFNRNADKPALAAASGQPLFDLKAVSFAISERVLLEPLTLCVPAKQVIGLIGLIGPNGSGKPTLVKLLARQQPVTSGSVLLKGYEPKTTN
jgi:ferric hydroxamate transport system ATP-binding protein